MVVSVLFAGRYIDFNGGFYYVRHRAYHPALGRWFQRDPAGYIDGMNLYEYVRGSPTGGTDPMGLKLVCKSKKTAGTNVGDSDFKHKYGFLAQWSDGYWGEYSAEAYDSGVLIYANVFGAWTRSVYVDSGSALVSYKVKVECQCKETGDCEISCDANVNNKRVVSGNVMAVGESSCEVAEDKQTAQVHVPLIGIAYGSSGVGAGGGGFGMSFSGAKWEKSTSADFSYACEKVSEPDEDQENSNDD